MKRILVLFSCLLWLSTSGFAQPAATGAVNAASYAAAGLPNGGLTQGGMFVIFGQAMGPAALQQVSAFPVPTDLGGTSVKVTAGGTTVDCFIIYTSAGQVAAILPSSTPTGAATLTVTYNGQTSAALNVQVVAHAFGIFALNSAGSGPAIITDNPTFVPNTLVHSAHEGEAWTIWGTGLGAIAGDDSTPQPGDLGLDVTVLVGSVEAQVLYRGRSGDNAGIDQINFFVPGGVAGCYVPVAVVVEGVTSNFVSMSIAESGDTCSEPSGLLTSQNLQTAQQNGSLRFGSLSLSRSSSSFSFPGVVSQNLESYSENASGDFWQFNLNQLLRTQSLVTISTFGACNVVQISGTGSGEETEFEDPVLPNNLNAGAALTITGPRGTETMPRDEFGYFKSFSTAGFPGVPGLPSFLGKKPGRVSQGAGPVFLVEGDYTITGPGGPDVGPFTANISIPAPLNWTNRDSITNVIRSQGQQITWSGGDTSGYVQISGSSLMVDEVTETFLGGFFFCRASAAAGSFNIPAGVLLALPVSTTIEGFSLSSLAVGNSTDGNTFEANGIDLGVITYSDESSKSVSYQ